MTVTTPTGIAEPGDAHSRLAKRMFDELMELPREDRRLILEDLTEDEARQVYAAAYRAAGTSFALWRDDPVGFCQQVLGTPTCVPPRRAPERNQLMSEQTFDERFAVLPDAVKQQLLRAHTVLSEMNQAELGHVSGVVHFARPDLAGPRAVLVEVFDVLLRLTVAVLLEQIGETDKLKEVSE
jgi:hypothetical protein